MADYNNKTESLRTDENINFVDHVEAGAEAFTLAQLDFQECFCIKTLIIERCTEADIKGFVKLASMFGMVESYNLDISQPGAVLESGPITENTMYRFNKAFLFSTIEHCIDELNRRAEGITEAGGAGLTYPN